MENEYIVGLDFGREETAAWIVPIDNNMPNGRHGKSLRLRNAANVYERTLWTVVYRNKNGDYSLNNNSGYYLSGFVKYHDEEFSEYIKLVYRRLMKNNNILISDEKGATNFYLSVSYPYR